jgi:Nucleotidyl transferase AbiEii toxin, Type IV TA system
MLHRAAVPLNLLEVLRALQEKTTAAGFALAGPTSLALRLGHRLSIDLDFFTAPPFDVPALAERLGAGPESITGQTEGTLQLVIDNVKVEFIRHAYPKLAADEHIQGVTLYSLEDVAAMKLNAIAHRGSKKDFYDIAALLERFPLETMIRFYQEKYRPASLLMLIRSLAWFDDADAEPAPVSLRNDTWPAIRETISAAIRTLE